ncbi:unnamed protein product, partial [Coregonus sp. 'balchen']
MTKRSYPFAESFSSQYKIHIGQKELNNHGVFGNKYRQEMYAVMGKIWNVDTEEKCSTIQPSGPGVTPNGCCVCQKAQGTRRQCSQCDRPACPSCTQQCSNCSSLCCSVCTVM